jgi:hypothetical protein
MGTQRPVRKLCVIAASLLAVSLLAVSLMSTSAPAEAATDRLPDLGMARLGGPYRDLQIQRTGDGKRLLRFSSTVVNIGPGNFELRGKRDDPTAEMSVTQRVFDDAGGYRDRTTTATMFFAGDGHDHWHVKDLAHYTLKPYGSRRVVRKDTKQGFCFVDNRRFGSSQPARYTGGCAHGDPLALRVTMGLSKGWGDLYRAGVVGQYVNVTGLKPGRYRLGAKADPGGRFKERNENNNFTWVDIRLKGDRVIVIDYGPAAKPI